MLSFQSILVGTGWWSGWDWWIDAARGRGHCHGNGYPETWSWTQRAGTEKTQTMQKIEMNVEKSGFSPITFGHSLFTRSHLLTIDILVSKSL